MKKSLLSTVMLLFSFLLTIAAPVDEQSARKIANDFISGKMPQVTRSASGNLTRALTGVADGEDAGIYVFNVDNGFVVISADDELPSVLAYGLSEPYDAQTAPPAMKAMLEAYHYAVVSAVKTRAAVPTHNEISPLIKTKWNQGVPYNKYCPKDESGNACPTGCVATAMAQVMYYHQWPNTIDWDAMKTTYSSTDADASAEAVAKLMADLGDKVFMDYATEGSSASEIEACEAFRMYYGYAETAERIDRSCYTAKAWDEVIYNELKASRPVLFTGQSASSGQQISGHAFVIDGYQATDGVGYYHINWGWGGNSDEYFLLSVLNPEKQYTGGNAGSSGYSFDQYAVIGIEKGKLGGEQTTRFYTGSCAIKGDKGSFTRTSTSDNFPTMQLILSLWNVTLPDEARHYDLAIALYQDRKQVKIIDSLSLKDVITGGEPIEYMRGFSSMTTGGFAFGKGLADGTYQLRLLSRETGKKQWLWAMGAACRYVELTINGTSMTTTTYGRYTESDVSAFTINSVTVSDDCEVGKPMTITVNLTDKNHTSNAPIFLYGNASLEKGTDDYQFLTGGGTNLEPGETGDVVLEYTPQRAGKFVFYLSGNSNSLTDYLYRFEATVSGMALNMDLDVDGAKSTSAGSWNETTGTTLKGTLYLTNYGTETYDNPVNINLYGGDAPDNIAGVSSKKEPVNIAIGETKDIPFSFENLTIGNYYLLLFTAKDGKDDYPLNYEIIEQDGKKYIRYYYKYIYLLMEDTAIQDIKLDAPDADVYDMHGVRLGKAADLKTLPKGIYIINKKKVVNK